MELIQIPPEAAPKVWPLALKMLAKAYEYADGKVAPEQDLKHIIAKTKQLWVVVDPESETPKNKAVAVGVSSLQINDDGTKTANIETLGGEGMKDWFSLRGEFEEWAKREGCKDVRLWARKGWVKHLVDFKLTAYIMRKEL